MDEVVKAGRAEFPNFDDASHFVVSMSADPMALRDTLSELGDDAHRTVARLADDPDEAARLLALRGPKLGAALAQYSAKAPTAAKSQAAPEPEAVPTLRDPAAPMKAWVAAYDRRNEGQQPYAPKSADLYSPDISDRDFNLEMDRREREKRAVVIERAQSYAKLMRKAP